MVQHNKNWKYVSFCEAVDICDTQRKPINSKERAARIEGKAQTDLYPYYGATGQVGYIDDYITDGEFVLLGEDGAPFLNTFAKKAYIITGKACVTNHAHVLCSKGSNKFLCYYLNYFNYKGYVSGTTRLKLTQAQMRRIPVPIPPIEEQNHIVARIEELFSELDNGVETLQKTKQQLAVYRQAVLKQAFDGKLTGCTSMRELALKDLVYGKDGLRRGPFGSAIKKAFFVPDGFKVYEQGNAINDDPYRGHYYITQEKYEELKNFHIKPHDLLVSCSGVTLGRIVELPENAKPGVINQALLRIRLNHEIIATRYFIDYFRSEMFQRKIFDKSQGSAMPNLVGITEFREITLNVPVSIDDQLAIVDEIENRLSVCDNIEKTVDTALQQAVAMRQSILKQAFEGKL